MRLYLNVSYIEKDEAKELGARWDSKKKLWYFTIHDNTTEKYIEKISKWLKYEIIICGLYVVESKRICHKCGKETTVIALGCNSFYEAQDLEFVNHYDAHPAVLYLFYNFTEDDIPAEYLKYIIENYPVKTMFSYYSENEYFANYCEHCRTIQGNNYIYVDSDNGINPFDDTVEDNIKHIKFKKLDNNVCLNVNWNWFGTLNTDLLDKGKY